MTTLILAYVASVGARDAGECQKPEPLPLSVSLTPFHHYLACFI